MSAVMSEHQKTPVKLSEEKERGSEVREKTKVQTMQGLPATL